MKQTNIVIRVEDELKEAFARLAASQDMSVSQMMRRYMRQATGYVTAPLPDPTLPRKAGEEIEMSRQRRAKTMAAESWLNEAAKHAGVTLQGDMTVIETAQRLNLPPAPHIIARIQAAFEAFGFDFYDDEGQTVYTVK